MAATKSDISYWFDTGVAKGATHLIVVCDTYDHDDYPVYVMPGEDVKEKEKQYQGQNMQRVMEVYNLKQHKTKQMAQHRAFNY